MTAIIEILECRHVAEFLEHRFHATELQPRQYLGFGYSDLVHLHITPEEIAAGHRVGFTAVLETNWNCRVRQSR
jgi:hypothetical protein